MGLLDKVPIIGPLLSGAGSMIGNIISNRANRRLAEYEYSKNLEMWNKQNAYNSPVAQMDRLKQAGLNPNMVYGTGTVVGNTSSQLPKYNAPSMRPVIEPNMVSATALNQYADVKVKQAQVDNLKAQNANILADTQNKLTDNVIKVIQSDVAKETKMALIRRIFNESIISESKTDIASSEQILKRTEALKGLGTYESEILKTQAQAKGAVTDAETKAYNLKLLNTLTPAQQKLWLLITQGYKTFR